MNALRQSFITKRLSGAYSSKTQQVGVFLNSPKGVFTLLVLVLVMAGSLSYTLYALRSQESEAPPSPQEVVETSSAPFRGAGSIGEPAGSEAQGDAAGRVALDKPLQGKVITVFVFTTSGTVKEIGERTLLIRGNGSNFADGLPRDLTVGVTSDTNFTIFGERGQTKGLIGLLGVSVGDRVIVESSSNIRGYDTFTASYVALMP